MDNIIKLTLRSIKKSFGRFIAIFAIIALGVGFFSGLRITRDAMVDTGNEYLEHRDMFDIRLLSNYGFTEKEIEKLSELRYVETVKGSYFMDIVYKSDNNSESALKLHSITDGVNTPELIEGRFPESSNECVLDARNFSSSYIGRKIILTDSNSEDVLNGLSYREYKVVGLVSSPLYINFDRGTTNLANGKVSGFMYVLPETFTAEAYSELFLKLKHDYFIYTDEYKNFIEDFQYSLKPVCSEITKGRLDSIVFDAQKKINAGLAEYEAGLKEYEKGELLAKGKLALSFAALEISKIAYDSAVAGFQKIEDVISNSINNGTLTDTAYEELLILLQTTKDELEVKRNEYNTKKAEYEAEKKSVEEELESAKKQLDDAKAELDSAMAEIDSMEEAKYYILTRETNYGYVSFENDTKIVYAISSVFPVFFFLVAALVCNTTMSRMVVEERGQIGILKALGFKRAEIHLSYLLYSGIAAILGCVFGFLLGSYAIPAIIWEVYKILYGFAKIKFLFSIPLFLISLAVSLICSVGVTFVSTKRILKEAPASLIRPKEHINGKLSFIERIPLIKHSLGFFGKISIRNTLKYKGRLVMMILGIAGCTALLIAGFGIDDSIAGMVDEQYENIMSYDYILSLKSPMTKDEIDSSFSDYQNGIKESLFIYEETVSVTKGDTTKQLTLSVPAKSDISSFINLKNGNEGIFIPGKDECVITRGIASVMDIKIGDTLTFTDSNGKKLTYTVAAICDNHVGNYVYVSSSTYFTADTDEKKFNRICINVREGNNVHDVAALSVSNENVSSISINSDTRKGLDDMLECLNLIVYLVIICAGALAFIVIYNLTNLTITERLRELATLKVIGFKKIETGMYIFRESALQSLGGIIVGLPLGILLLGFVMDQIKIDFVSFDSVIHTSTYIISVLLTLVFLVLVDLILFGKIKKINAAEALKSVE